MFHLSSKYLQALVNKDWTDIEEGGLLRCSYEIPILIGIILFGAILLYYRSSFRTHFGSSYPLSFLQPTDLKPLPRMIRHREVFIWSEPNC
jgi:hypothetical protein